MAGFRIVLLLLLLGLIEVKATNNQGLTYSDALTTAVTYFNEKTNETNSFWLRAAEPQPHWEPTRSGRRGGPNLYVCMMPMETGTACAQHYIPSSLNGGQNNTSREPHYLSCTAKEIECQMTENITPITCVFKKNGKEKYCQGRITAINEEEANVWIRCVPQASHKAVRAKRGIPKFIKKAIKTAVKEAVKAGVSQVLKKKPNLLQ